MAIYQEKPDGTLEVVEDLAPKKLEPGTLPCQAAETKKVVEETANG